jgi:phenylalanine-4-hydroxylase
VVARIGGPAPTGPGLRTSLAVLAGPVQVSRGGVALGDPRELPAVLALDRSCGPPPGSEPAVGIGPSAVTGLPGGPGRFHVALPGGVELQGVATGGLEVAELRGRAGSRELDLPRRALLLRGRSVPSVAGGPADPGAWERAFGAGGLAGGEGEARARARKAASLPAEAAALYERVRALREAGGAGPAEVAVLRRAAAGHPGEWLLAEEIEELAGTGGAPARYAASPPEPGLFR